MTAGNVDNGHERVMLPSVEHDPTRPRILIAEDHPATQDLLCWILRLAGYHPTVCASRQAALTWKE
ncbi:MAG TPA: hypothetical protein VFA09_22885 [Ktedonobacteraceae bacterium]|nr:hypothetical protein [Ktedonobacteraceae bacterium]